MYDDWNKTQWTKYLCDSDWHSFLDQEQLRILRDHATKTIAEINHLKKKLPQQAVYRSISYRFSGMSVEALVKILEELKTSLDSSWKKRTCKEDPQKNQQLALLPREHGVKEVIISDPDEEMIGYGYGGFYGQRALPSRVMPNNEPKPKFPLLRRGKDE